MAASARSSTLYVMHVFTICIIMFVPFDTNDNVRHDVFIASTSITPILIPRKVQEGHQGGKPIKKETYVLVASTIVYSCTWYYMHYFCLFEHRLYLIFLIYVCVHYGREVPLPFQAPIYSFTVYDRAVWC